MPTVETKTFQTAYGLTEGDKSAVSAHVKDLPEWIRKGCADETEYLCEEKGATFKYSYDEEALPCLDAHNTYLTDVLKAPGGMDIWKSLRGETTKLGVKLTHCLKTGIDNPGHPQIKTVGLVAGDEESFTLFKTLFDPVISGRHNGYAPDAKHTSDMNAANLSTTPIDPTGKFTLTTRCRTGRSIRGTCLPPCNSFVERRQIECDVVEGLLSMDGELKGTYLPLAGNKSGVLNLLGKDADNKYANGMLNDQEEDLRSRGNLFQEPDSTLLLSSGCGRHWPDARGIFHNEAKNFFVWVNEEDQMRIISMQPGADVNAIFVRFANATSAVAKCLKANGKDFMFNDHLGFILTCPSNLGTGLRAGTMAKVPLFSGRDDFKKVLAKMKLQARGCAGVDSDSKGGVWDISNADRLGFSEVQLVNRFIEGLAQIITWEQELMDGKTVDFDGDIAKFEEKLTALAAKAC